MKRSAPDARAVARRAIALKFVSLHAISTHDASLFARWRMDMPASQWRAVRASSRLTHQAFLDEARGYNCAFSPREQAFMDSDPLRLPEREHIGMTWRSESLAVLAWALGYGDPLPDLHRPMRGEFRRIPANNAAAFLRGARLRPSRQLQFARAAAAQRLRRERSETTQSPPLRWDAFANAWLGRGDFKENWFPAAWIARERLHALNWLCGYAPGNRWDETPADIAKATGEATLLAPRQAGRLRALVRAPAQRPKRGQRRTPRRRIAVVPKDSLSR